MATYTANYQLHQWVPEDNFLRTDFNQDFQKIDSALASLQTQTDSKASSAALSTVETLAGRKCEITCGTYVGDGAASRTITLGFQPKAVHLEAKTGLRGGSTYHMYGGLAVQGGGLSHTYTALSIAPTGFQVFSQDEARTNTSGEGYRYIAFL